MSGEDPSASASAALLEELKAIRLANEKLQSTFEEFKTDTSAKISNLEKQNEELRRGESSAADTDELLYVSHDGTTNPFPRRPRNTTVKPQCFDLYGDRTADCLELKQNSSLRWEYRTLAPALSYFHDAKVVYDSFREEIISKLPEVEGLALEAVFNTLDGVYDLHTQRYATIKIRTRAEAEPGGLSEENKLLLDYLDAQLHGVFPGEALVDSKMEAWLAEFNTRKAAAKLKSATNSGEGKKAARSTSEAASSSGKVTFADKAKAEARKGGFKPKSKAK